MASIGSHRSLGSRQSLGSRRGESSKGASEVDKLEKTRLHSRSLREQKECDFLRGVHTNMPDDFCAVAEPSNPAFTAMKWAYPDGKGANCHVCERIWQVELSHHWGGQRQVYKDACKTDLNLLKLHRERRRAHIQRKSKGADLGEGTHGERRGQDQGQDQD